MTHILTSARRCAGAATLAVVVAALAACSGGGSRSSAPTTEGKVPAAPAGHVETIKLDAADYGPISAQIPNKPLAEAPSAVDGIQIEVFVLSRSDKSVTLVLALHNTTTARAGFDNTTFYAEDAGDMSVSNLSLLDATGLKQYLTFREPATEPAPSKKLGPCLCSSSAGIFQIDPGQRSYLAAIFPAPPADVTKLTVQAGFGTVPSVPLKGG